MQWLVIWIHGVPSTLMAGPNSFNEWRKPNGISDKRLFETRPEAEEFIKANRRGWKSYSLFTHDGKMTVAHVATG